LRLIVAAERRSGVDVGAPVFFRGVQVGEVEKLRLAPDARWVHIGVRIEPGYRALVRRSSKFWNVSGVKIDVGLLGAKADIDSLQSAIGGGIEFATPNELGDPVSDGAVFFLYDKPDPTWKEWAPARSRGFRSHPTRASPVWEWFVLVPPTPLGGGEIGPEFLTTG